MSITGPCDWGDPFANLTAVEEGVFERIGEEQAEAVKQAAVNYLWNWTGRVFGLCEVTVHPCLTSCRNKAVSPLQVMWAGRGASMCCDTGCTCWNTGKLLRLPGPIHSVTEVTYEGMAFTDFQIVNSRWLGRTDGQTWPRVCDGELVITYKRGVEAPSGGRIAAKALALELAKAVGLDNTCKLPQRVQNITRQGVSVTMLDAFEGLSEGKTGIWIVDSWIASIRQTRDSSSVLSVDVPRPGQNRYVK